MQLYEQILKEFNKKFPQLLRKRLYEELELNGKITIECINEIKSFLKQSFIKFLESECERLGKSKKEKPDLSDCKKWYDKNECGSCGEMFGNYIGYNQALSDTISHYQNIIKELHEKTT